MTDATDLARRVLDLLPRYGETTFVVGLSSSECLTLAQTVLDLSKGHNEAECPFAGEYLTYRAALERIARFLGDPDNVTDEELAQEARTALEEKP